MGLTLNPGSNTMLGYSGISSVDPLGMDFSLGIPAPMAPLSTGQNTVTSATTAAVSSSPVTPSGSAHAVNPAAPAADVPQFNPITGEQLNPGFFQKGGGFSVALGALQTLGNLWNSFQQAKIAKDTLNFQKEAYQTNLANTTKDYNTRLKSDANAYAAYTGRSEADTAQYVKDHSL